MRRGTVVCVGEHEEPRLFEVVWEPAGHMIVRWADGTEDTRPAGRAETETFAFEHDLRLCHVTGGGGLCLRALADCH